MEIARERQSIGGKVLSPGIPPSQSEKEKLMINKKVRLPDGTSITFEDEWNKCYDIYFNHIYTKQMSIQEMLHWTLQTLEPPFGKEIRIMLTGGATQAGNFRKKLQEEYDAMFGLSPLPAAKNWQEKVHLFS